MKESRFVNQVFNGMWKCVKYKKPRYTLKNIYNGKEIILNTIQMQKVADGKDEVSKIMSRRIALQHNPIDTTRPWVTNTLTKSYFRQRWRYANGTNK